MAAMMTGTHGGPVVIWTPPPIERYRPHPGRVAGAAVGFLVAAGVLLVTWPADSSGQSSLAVPTLLAGTIGSWAFGRSVWTSQRDAEWVQAIVGLGFLTLFVGALATGLSLGLASAAESATSLGQAIELVWSMTFVFAALGLIFLGIFALPITLISAVVWGVVMILVRAWATTDDD
jgi:hypothetical protein